MKSSSKLSFNGGHINLPRLSRPGDFLNDAESEAAHTEDANSPRANHKSVFGRAVGCAEDPILGMRDAFIADPANNKLNVAVGVYRTEDGKPLVLKAVQDAEAAMLEEQKAGKSNKEYLPADGIEAFCDASLHLLFGDSIDPALSSQRVVATQSLSGLGGLHLAGRMIGELMPAGTTVYLPEPTWPIHADIFETLGIRVATYPYYDSQTCSLKFGAMLQALTQLPAGAVVLFHACAHNPTGCDPSEDQWAQIANVVSSRGLIPLIDSAYQGFATGDLVADGFGARTLASIPNVELMVCQSYAKNLGLYAERVGCFAMICADADVAELARQQLKRRIRLTYSSPPMHGAAIVTRVLTEPARRQAWAAEVAQMAERLRASRVVLHAVLTKIGCPPPHGTRLSTWQHVLDQRGMFTYTGLTTAQVDRLRVRHHIYMPRDGRICMATLNADSCEVLAAAIKTVLDETSETLDGSSDGGAAESTSPRVSDAGDEGQQHTAKKPRV